MAIESAHKHLGFKIQYDALVPVGTIVINPADLEALHFNTAKTASEFSGSLEEALADTQVNATQVGPLSGPSSGTGPVIPIGTAVTKEILPANPLDTHPNALSPELEAGQDDKATTIVTDQNLAPYPTGDVPAVPTTKEPVDAHMISAVEWDAMTPEHKDSYLKEHPGTVVTDAKTPVSDPEYPDTAPEPLPSHPAIENEPPAAETPEHEYLRKEEEAKHVDG
jgi:hypothetical protein